MVIYLSLVCFQSSFLFLGYILCGVCASGIPHGSGDGTSMSIIMYKMSWNIVLFYLIILNILQIWQQMKRMKTSLDHLPIKFIIKIVIPVRYSSITHQDLIVCSHVLMRYPEVFLTKWDCSCSDIFGLILKIVPIVCLWSLPFLLLCSQCSLGIIVFK